MTTPTPTPPPIPELGVLTSMGFDVLSAQWTPSGGGAAVVRKGPEWGVALWNPLTPEIEIDMGTPLGLLLKFRRPNDRPYDASAPGSPCLDVLHPLDRHLARGLGTAVDAWPADVH